MSPSPSIFPTSHWRGLGAWNLYFLAKLALAWFGFLNFRPWPNLAFAAALLLPLPALWMHRVRNIVAIPVAIGLLYHDTWFPPLSRVLEARSDLAGFSLSYQLELITRLVNWNVVAGGLVLLVAYLFVSQWLRLTTVNLTALSYLAVIGLPPPTLTIASNAPVAVSAQATTATTAATAIQVSTPGLPAQTLPPTSNNLNAYLNAFYTEEQSRRTTFPAQASETTPFDVLVINICSLAWADLEAVHLRDHPLFSKLDIVFDNFNSAASYSGPASIRLLRASCGQEPHKDLYVDDAPECFLFENLDKLGFTRELVLNHTGQYEDYLQSIRKQGNMPAPSVNTRTLRNPLVAFDGTPIWSDQEVLELWWQQRQKLPTPRTATFYNTITLHDGNRSVQADGSIQRIDFQPRAQKLLDQLTAFIDRLQSSGRHVLLVIVPEHGAALHGDRMQIDGMREIPSASITHIPAGLKLIGMKNPRTDPTMHITAPSSYLAVSELVARLIDGKAFTTDAFDWVKWLANLPETAPVSENEGTVVLQYQGSPFVRMKGADWIPYPH